MAVRAGAPQLASLSARFAAFVTERYPFAVADVLTAFESAGGRESPHEEAAIDALRSTLGRELSRAIRTDRLSADLPDTTPRTRPHTRLRQAREELIGACDGFLRRAAIEASLSAA